jgi:hypothetical protein
LEENLEFELKRGEINIRKGRVDELDKLLQLNLDL